MRGAAALTEEWASAWEPPPDLSVSAWAELYRMLPETSAARGGKWSNETAPYLVGIMDASRDPHVRKIALMKAHQSGGPLSLDTPIPTPSGWTTMGEIQPGDAVFDENGEPCFVTASSPVFPGRKCYRVMFSDGSSIVCDGEHRWFVHSDKSLTLAPGCTGRPRGTRDGSTTRQGVLRTEEILASGWYTNVKRQPNGKNRYAIPVAKALRLPSMPLPVDPYALGVWLGDGNSYSTQVTQHHRDAGELAGHLRAVGLTPTVVGKSGQADSVVIALDRAEEGRNVLARQLAELGLMKSRRARKPKHIPEVYLRASFAQRLDLLQGLMDTDGTCGTNGRCSFATTIPELRDGAIELMRTLGLKPLIRTKPGRIKRAHGHAYQCADGWEISFTAYNDLPVFRLSRKLARQVDRGGRRPSETERRRLVAVEPVESVPVRCISVTSASHLYLAGSAMVPTHNSEALNNVLGFHIHHDPCPILVVHPTADVAQSYSKERLADMIRSTPALAAVVRDKAQPRTQAHQAESTLALKIFPGGFLALGGANTPNTFARWSVRLAIADDVDRFPPVVGDEGDPADLLVNRTTSFYDALTIFVSTPTLKGGRIDTLYSRSDQRRYFVPCLACGREDWITWSDPQHLRVVYDGQDAESARLECPCGARMTEPDRRRMVARGDWRPTREPEEAGLAGFHLPAMVSTLGEVTLQGLVARWLSARTRGKEALRVFINTSLAEGWEDRGGQLEPQSLLARAKSYGEGVEVPAEGVCLTAGVDLQLDRFELQVIGWGPAAERWVVDWRAIPGNPKRAETQAALLEALAVRYRHASGRPLKIAAVCIDSGYATEEVYDLVLAHQHRGIFATKGIAGRSGEPIIGRVNERTYGSRRRPVRLYPVNVDDAKAEIMAALAVSTPGPGCMHFPDRVDEEYFAQLCAEHRETRKNKAGVATHSVWVQDRDRNEALDTAVLALAAFRLIDGPRRIRQMAERLAAMPPEKPGEAGRPEPAPAQAPHRPAASDGGGLDVPDDWLEGRRR